MPEIEFVGQSGRDADSAFANTSRLINCYREPIQSARSTHQIKSALGTQSFVDLSAVFMREMAAVQGVLYAASGGQLFSITTTGTKTDLGAITDGDTSISSNNGTVTVAAGGTYYTWDGTTLATPTTGALSSVGSVTFLGQYTVITEADGRRFQWSALADGETFDALDFATKEARDDNVLRCEAVNGRLVLFGAESIEVWTLTTASGANAFSRVPGGVVDVGLKSYPLMVRMDQGVFFVGDDGVVYLFDGGNLTPISTRPVETAVDDGDPVDCIYWEDEGHKFCAIVFDDRPAWVFDMSTAEWHERAEGTDLNAWRARSTARIGGQWYVGDYQGKVRKMMRNNADAASPLVRVMVSNTLYIDGNRARIAELELFARTGITSLTRPVKAVLRMSRDNGHTYSPDREKSLGLTGEYDKRVLWRNLGQYRQVTAEVSVSDPSEVSFLSTGRVRVA